MESLILREEKTYDPEEVNLDAPLVFANPELELVYAGLEFPIQRVKTKLERLIIESQVSRTEFDRVTIPVWMIEGDILDGFFKGALRPHRSTTQGEFIDISSRYFDLHFYLETDGTPQIGKNYIGQDINPKLKIQTGVNLSQNPRKRESIGPNFKVYELQSPTIPVLFRAV